MRSRISLVLLLVVALVLSATSAIAGEVGGDLHTGLYSDDFYSSGDLNGVGSASGQKVTFGGTFHDVAENNGVETTAWSNTRELLEGVWSAKATPFANVGVKASAASVAAGNHDADIAIWVSHVKTFLDRGEQRSLIVAPLQEHNGNWTSYGCNPAGFKAAYRKFVDAFRKAGIGETQVRFAWAPNGWTSPGCGTLSDYYPGDDIVDVISISAYNFGTCFANANYQIPAEVFDTYLNEIRQQINGTKPFMIAQTASPRPSCGGGQSAWTLTMIEHLAKDPNVVGFVWFNFNHSWETDWRVWTGSSLTPGWKQAVDAGHTKYQWPLTDWFTPGELTVGPPTPEVVPCGSGPCDSVVWVDSGSHWGVRDGLYKSAPISTFYFGNPGDVPFMGDWDGDGEATPGLFRQSDGYVYVKDENTQGIADLEFFFGNPGDVPLVGDFDGDGRDSVSIWRPSQARVFVINELGRDGEGLGAADFDFYFGNPGDTPFVGDFDGDGVDTIGLYRQSTGFVYFTNRLATGNAALSFFFGDPGDQILAGDWDGDGDDTVGVYRPSTGRVYVNLENTNGAADWSGYVGSHLSIATAGNQ
jgi:hypothetical protein